MDKGDSKALNDLIKKRFNKDAIVKTFNTLYKKCTALQGSKRDIFLFEVRLHFYEKLHEKLMKNQLKECFKILDIALTGVQIESPVCSATWILWPLKLVCLIICFQSMSTLELMVNFCVEKQESFKNLVAKKATMNFLLTFNILAKRLVGQEQLLGRLRKFNAYCLGLDNRSNFNIGGSFNNSITTDPREEELDDGRKINEVLYKQLWKVMKVCQNPKLLLATTKDGVKWKDFKSDIEEILKAFKAQPIDVKAAKVGSQISLDQLQQEFIFPQYVTSSRIFHYQLDDPTFRRHILLQVCMCIIGHYQLQKCEQSSIRSRQPILRIVQRADQNWIVKTFEECIQLLEKTQVFTRTMEGDVIYSADGSKRLASSFRDIMLREFNYVHWKHDRSTKQKACPNLCKPPQKPVEPFVYEATKTENFNKMMQMGDPMVTPLWKSNCNMDMLEQGRPDLSKEMEKNINGLVEDMTDKFLTDSPEMKRMFDAKHSFHTLRLIQRCDPTQMDRLHADFKEIIQGGAVTNTLYQVLNNKDPKLGAEAKKDAEALGFVKPKLKAKLKEVVVVVKDVKEEPKKVVSKKVTKKPPAQQRKRASPLSKEERAAKRKKFENVSLDDLTK